MSRTFALRSSIFGCVELSSTPQSIMRQKAEYCRIEDGSIIDKHVVCGVGHHNWLGYWSAVSHCRRHFRKVLGAVLPVQDQDWETESCDLFATRCRSQAHLCRST